MLEGQRDALLKAAVEVRAWIDNWTMPMDDDPDWPADYRALADAIAQAAGGGT